MCCSVQTIVICITISWSARVVTQTAVEGSPLGCIRGRSLHGWGIRVKVDRFSILVLDHVLVVQRGRSRDGARDEHEAGRDDQSCRMTQASEQPTTRDRTPRSARQNLGSLG